MQREQLLKDLYFRVPTKSGEETAALSNEEALYKLAKRYDPSVTKNDVRRFLKDSVIYVKQKEPAKRKNPSSVIESGQPGIFCFIFNFSLFLMFLRHYSYARYYVPTRDGTF